MDTKKPAPDGTRQPRAWQEQLDAWGDWLDQHGDDPALLAACQRIGRLLAEGGAAR